VHKLLLRKAIVVCDRSSYDEPIRIVDRLAAFHIRACRLRVRMLPPSTLERSVAVSGCRPIPKKCYTMFLQSRCEYECGDRKNIHSANAVGDGSEALLQSGRLRRALISELSEW
jgi:hypothetical protein